MRPIRKPAFGAALAAAIAALATPAAAAEDSIYLRLNETGSASGQNDQIEIDDFRMLPGLWEGPDGKLKGGSTGVLNVVLPAGACHAGKRYRSAEVATWDRVVMLTDLTLIGCLPARASRSRPMQSVSFGYMKMEIKYR